MVISILSFSRVLALPQLRSNAMQWQTVEEPLLCSPQIKANIKYTGCLKKREILVQMAITPPKIEVFWKIQHK